MKNLVDQINAQIEVFSVNAAAQVEKNNKAAGTRARKAVLWLRTMAIGIPPLLGRGTSAPRRCLFRG